MTAYRLYHHISSYQDKSNTLTLELYILVQQGIAMSRYRMLKYVLIVTRPFIDWKSTELGNSAYKSNGKEFQNRNKIQVNEIPATVSRDTAWSNEQQRAGTTQK